MGYSTDMKQKPVEDDRALLQRIAQDLMEASGMLAAFKPRVVAQVNKLSGAATDPAARDLRDLAWCSIDNDDSYDLDQLSVAIGAADGATRLLVAIADVDALVPLNSPVDLQARHNTASIYTSAQIFPMLPERLSTDLTSLNPDQDRLAIVIDMTIDGEGGLVASDVYRGTVRNRAKLAYDAVAAWLDNEGLIPAAIAPVPGLEANIRLQDEIAQRLRAKRRKAGALDFESIEARPEFDGSIIVNLVAQEGNRAKELIEEFMIAANGVTARYLAAAKFPSLRRIVRVPKRWDKIILLAAEHDVVLPPAPSSRALNRFLAVAKKAYPERFPDISLDVIKLMGAGEYAVELPGKKTTGHFGLAVRDYAHSTAPNRRYPDLITQRLLKAALRGDPSPYDRTTLQALAERCTEAEEIAKKIERQVEKSAAALVLRDRVGHTFDGIISGMTDAGTWVRLIDPPVEGRLTERRPGTEPGQNVRVVLLRTDVENGFVDFKLEGSSGPRLGIRPHSPRERDTGNRPGRGRKRDAEKTPQPKDPRNGFPRRTQKPKRTTHRKKR